MKFITLQKYLQDSGFDSRRNIRRIINEGKIKINGTVSMDPHRLIDPSRDRISCGNRALYLKMEKKVYFKFNKPAGVVSTLNDPQQRLSLKEYLKKINQRVYPVGRLDFHSEGLLLLTNDGEFTNFIISVKNRIPKVYLVKVKGIIPENKLKVMKTRGKLIDGSKVKPKDIRFIRKTKNNNSWLAITLIEGKKHVVRKFFGYSGHPVVKLKRTTIGNIHLKRLSPGHWSELSAEEIASFKKKYNFRGSSETTPGARKKSDTSV